MKRSTGLAFIFSIATVIAFAQGTDPYAYSGNNNDNYYYQTDNNNYATAPAPVTPDENATPDYQTFYNQLSPYGNWVNYPGYGMVWVPTQVASGFSPYMTSGHWAYTDYGWTWVSDYAWGWAPFHYGRWLRDNIYGWLWVPGYEWASAWVVWGNYNDYYCWAPLAPGYGFNNCGYYHPAEFCWNFLPHAYIGCARPVDYRIDYHRACGEHTVVINRIEVSHSYRNIYYCAGPSAQEVEHYSGHPVVHNSVAVVHRPTVRTQPVNVQHPEVRNEHVQANRGNAPVNYNRPNTQIFGRQQYNAPVQQQQFRQSAQQQMQSYHPAQQQYHAPVQQQPFRQSTLQQIQRPMASASTQSYRPAQQQQYHAPVQQQARQSAPQQHSGFNSAPAARPQMQQRPAMSSQASRQFSQGSRQSARPSFNQGIVAHHR
ncbi:MAG TPA: DUF6600 domain-containing protein [Chitinophagales bacterium]|nr:DUF6600 domain-containing protein [Chitinophagales bacterium]